MVLVGRADEKPPRLSVGSLPAASTESVKEEKGSGGWFLGQIKKVELKSNNFIGWCYEKGKVLAKNEKEAFKWYSKSAEQGDADAQNKIGRCYEKGKGVAKDEKEAFEDEGVQKQTAPDACHAQGNLVHGHAQNSQGF